MTNELEQTIIELENELENLNSYIFELHINYDEQLKSLDSELYNKDKKINDLEHELFLEKTSDSKHKFYWFTTKKRPPISDVSYTNNENDFYGFKQVPKYELIEQHDLRFITNCSFDDIIEQYR